MLAPTTRDASDELFGWLIRFLAFSERRWRNGLSVLEPLFNLTTCWEFWWESSVGEEDRREIQNSAALILNDEQKGFVDNLREWFSLKFGGEAPARFALLQVSNIPVFAQWRAFDDVRASCLNRINFPVLRSGADGAIEGLCVFLRPRTSGEPAIKCSEDVLLGPADISQARDGVMNSLSNLGILRTALVGSLAGWLSARAIGRFVALLIWLAVLSGIAAIVICGPWLDHYAVKYVLVAVLWLYVLVVLFPTSRVLKEVRFGVRLRNVLETHQICILPGNLGRGSHVVAVGSSFTLALGVGILSSAFEAARPSRDSWLWGWLYERLKHQLANWAFTGVLRSNGAVVNVDKDHMATKYEACRNHPDITVLVMPKQNLDIPLLAPKFDRLIRPSPGFAPVAASSALRVYRSRDLSSVLLDIGGIRSRVAALNTILGLLCSMCLLAGTPEIWRMFHPPPIPKPVVWKCEDAYYSKTAGPVFHLVVETESPSAFVVRIATPVLSKERIPFYPDRHAVGQAWAEIPLPNTPGHGLDTSILVVLPQTFLGRELKDTVILEEKLDGLRLAAAAEKEAFFRQGKNTK
ncbi:MAG: hypothetical protein C5B50_05220 [Verrucomicrobia bacterium]|nr:MAG: hypothetical protein C5B50_05220 [Verrucomicrobiota bacterium]